MEKYATFDAKHLPVIMVTFTGEKSSDENFIAYLEALNLCYKPKEKIALIFDARKASMPDFKHQKMQAKWLKDNEEMMKSFCLGTAYIINNFAIRTVLKLIFAIQQQPVPYKIFASEDDAMRWTKSLFTGN